MQCKNHNEKEAIFHCVSCGNDFCGDCINARQFGNFTAQVCRGCGGRCDEIGAKKKSKEPQSQVAAVQTEQISFWEEMPKVFAYPFMGNGKWVLLAGSIFFGIAFKVVQLAGLFGLPLFIILISYLTVYMLHVIESTAYGSDEPPDWPDMVHFIDVVFGPLLLIVLATAMCYAPAVFYLFHTHNFNIIFFLLFVLGQFMHPMFLLSIATTERFSALNPIVVIVSIFRAPVEYFVMFLLFVVMVVLQQISAGMLRWVPLVGFMLVQCVMIYFVLAQMRLLGIFYRASAEKLGGSTGVVEKIETVKEQKET